MSWRVVVRPEAEQDMVETAQRYETQQPGLGAKFIREVVQVWDEVAENPFLNSRRHPTKNIRWRYPEHFPHRVVYEIIEPEKLIVIAAVLHASRQDWHWKSRIESPD